MSSQNVLVIGGTGYFGRLLVDDLVRNVSCNVIAASRRPLRSDRFRTIIADLHDHASLERALDGVAIAICAAGPYQDLPLTLLGLCVERGIHYIDLADDRGFVKKVRHFAANREPGISAVCTGWSTVSALSTLLVKIAARDMERIDSIHIHMAPGNRGARQAATIASLLHSVGQPFTIFRNGEWRTVTGWSEPRDFPFPSPVGKRRGYLVDVPDHELLPAMFGARTVEFRAGSEFVFLNRCLGMLRRTGGNWSQWSGLLQRAAALFSWMGHDWGAIGVEVRGSATRRAVVMSESRAERIAVMPASVMAAELLSGASHRGVVSHLNWLSEDRLRQECEKRNFRFTLEEV